MKKTSIIFSVFLFWAISGFGQKASGYLGKRFSVSTGVGVFPFLTSDYSTANNYYIIPGISKRVYLNAEYAIGEYTGVGLDFSYHKNILMMFPKFDPFNTPGYDCLPYDVKCKNINPVVRFYNKSMSPAPLGNYISLGINYSMLDLSSAMLTLSSYPEFQNVDLYLSQGKLNFTDISFGFGRSFILAKCVLLKTEMSFPYVLHFFPAAFYTTDYEQNVDYWKLHDYSLSLSKTLRNKIVINNWFQYNITVGIPF
jgi:hypothetical protein